MNETILGGRVLRGRTPDGIEQEVWALLAAYQALRTAMTDTTDSVPGTDPDRAGFTTALTAARDQLVLAAGVTPGTTSTSSAPSAVTSWPTFYRPGGSAPKTASSKRAISKYNARGPAIDRTTYRATISIAMLTNGP